jgi:hypothetical protein
MQTIYFALTQFLLLNLATGIWRMLCGPFLILGGFNALSGPPGRNDLIIISAALLPTKASCSNCADYH